MTGGPYADTEVTEQWPSSPRESPWSKAISSWWLGLVAVLGGVLGGGMTSLIDPRQVGLVILLGLLTSTLLLALAAAALPGTSHKGKRLRTFMLGIWFSPISLPAAAATDLLLSSGLLR